MTEVTRQRIMVMVTAAFVTFVVTTTLITIRPGPYRMHEFHNGSVYRHALIDTRTGAVYERDTANRWQLWIKPVE